MLRISPHQAAGACDKCLAGNASEQMHCSWCGYDGDNFTEFIGHISGPCGAKMADAMMRYYDRNKEERDRRRQYRRRRR